MLVVLFEPNISIVLPLLRLSLVWKFLDLPIFVSSHILLSKKPEKLSTPELEPKFSWVKNVHLGLKVKFMWLTDKTN